MGEDLAGKFTQLMARFFQLVMASGLGSAWFQSWVSKTHLQSPSVENWVFQIVKPDSAGPSSFKSVFVNYSALSVMLELNHTKNFSFWWRIFSASCLADT